MLRTKRCPSTRETRPLSRLTISPVPTSLFSFLCIDYSQMLPVDTVACSDHFRVLFSPSSRDLHKEPSTLALPIGLIFFFLSLPFLTQSQQKQGSNHWSFSWAGGGHFTPTLSILLVFCGWHLICMVCRTDCFVYSLCLSYRTVGGNSLLSCMT